MVEEQGDLPAVLIYPVVGAAYRLWEPPQVERPAVLNTCHLPPPSVHEYGCRLALSAFQHLYGLGRVQRPDGVRCLMGLLAPGRPASQARDARVRPPRPCGGHGYPFIRSRSCTLHVNEAAAVCHPLEHPSAAPSVSPDSPCESGQGEGHVLDRHLRLVRLHLIP